MAMVSIVRQSGGLSYHTTIIIIPSLDTEEIVDKFMPVILKQMFSIIRLCSDLGRMTLMNARIVVLIVIVLTGCTLITAAMDVRRRTAVDLIGH